MADSFHEYRFLKNEPGTPVVRLFLSDYFELQVWLDDEGLCQFQLCYDRGYNEHTVTWWREGDRIYHHSVDQAKGLRGMSPLLVEPEFEFKTPIAERFARMQGTIPAEIHEFVGRLLCEFAAESADQ